MKHYTLPGSALDPNSIWGGGGGVLHHGDQSLLFDLVKAFD